MFRKIFIVILLSIAPNVNGQITKNFRYVDSITYSLYTGKSWNELIREGNRAVSNGHDFYYMRMRIGIAYYEKRNYVMSALHFRKALGFNENDQVALEYLFYSYYLGGRTNQAFALSSSFYPQNLQRILKESGIKKNSITIESFFSDASSGEILSSPDSYFSDSDPGSQIVTRYFINNEVYASHLIGNNTGYLHSYTNLIKDNFLNYFDGSTTARMSPQRIIQNQYYGSFCFFSSSGWYISPSIHLFTMRYPIISISTTGINHSIRSFDVRSNGLNAGLSVEKSIGFISLGAEAGYFINSSIKKMQGTLSLMVYPLGNSEIYFGGKLATGKEMNSGSSDLSIIKGFTAGFSIGRRVWLEFSGLAGDMYNYVDNNGLYIYNSSDILKSKITGRIIIPFPKVGLTISAGGGVGSYSSELFTETNTISYGTNKLNYNSINYTGGISWNF